MNHNIQVKIFEKGLDFYEIRDEGGEDDSQAARLEWTSTVGIFREFPMLSFLPDSSIMFWENNGHVL